MTNKTDNLEFSIKTYEGGHDLRVSPHDDGGVFLGLAMSGCRAYTTLTPDQALKLVSAITSILTETKNV